MKVPSIHARLPRSFYEQPTEVVARELLGKALLRRIGGRWIGGLIVETEAYLSEGDPASHSARGKTPSNAAMFEIAGTLYVYPIHAKHCMNVVTERVGDGSAVLIRAVEPVWGIRQMSDNRRKQNIRQLARGPAMLCQAIQVDRSQDKLDLISNDQLCITEGLGPIPDITATSRIGISCATDLPLRFFVDGNWFVSGVARSHHSQPAAHRRLVLT